MDSPFKIILSEDDHHEMAENHNFTDHVILP